MITISAQKPSVRVSSASSNWMPSPDSPMRHAEHQVDQQAGQPEPGGQPHRGDRDQQHRGADQQRDVEVGRHRRRRRAARAAGPAGRPAASAIDEELVPAGRAGPQRTRSTGARPAPSASAGRAASVARPSTGGRADRDDQRGPCGPSYRRRPVRPAPGFTRTATTAGSVPASRHVPGIEPRSHRRSVDGRHARTVFGPSPAHVSGRRRAVDRTARAAGRRSATARSDPARRRPAARCPARTGRTGVKPSSTASLDRQRLVLPAEQVHAAGQVVARPAVDHQHVGGQPGDPGGVGRATRAAPPARPAGPRRRTSSARRADRRAGCLAGSLVPARVAARTGGLGPLGSARRAPAWRTSARRPRCGRLGRRSRSAAQRRPPGRTAAAAAYAWCARHRRRCPGVARRRTSRAADIAAAQRSSRPSRGPPRSSGRAVEPRQPLSCAGADDQRDGGEQARRRSS